MWLDDARRVLAGVGVQVMGIADGRPYEHLLPGARSAVVFASGGPAIWQCIRATDADPIDDLVRRTLASLPVHPGQRWIRCANDDEPVDFMTLAVAAGLGHRSRLGLLVHPTYGPWLGLRALCLTTETLEVHGPLDTDSPCVGCAAPCASACPASAIGPDTLRLDACLDWQAREDSCHGGCLARSACVVGPEHAYSAAQHRYHHHPPSRADVLAHLETP